MSGSGLLQSNVCSAICWVVGSVLCWTALAAAISLASCGSAGVAAPAAGACVGAGCGAGPGCGAGVGLGACSGTEYATGFTGCRAGSAAPCGAGDGVAAPLGGVMAGVGVAPGAGAVPAGGAGAGAAGTGWPITGRKRSCAVCPSDRACSPASPGTVMVMLSPSRTTSAPLTPRPLTRCSMICWACTSWSRGGEPPSTVRATSVTRVPPCRSMPSFGAGLPSPVKKTSA